MNATSFPLHSPSEINSALSDRFTEWNLIGKGGFSEVYSALDKNLSRKVALKILRFDPQSEDCEQRILQQLKMVSQLQHPGVAQILDAIRTDAGLLLVQFLCEEGSLEDRLSKANILRCDALAWFQSICGAVAYMHDRNVLHCDLKPANILFDDRNQPVLIDFDLCRKLDEEGVRAEISLQGTPKYMAPELLSGRSAQNVHTEIYALGVILHELLSGHNQDTSNPAVQAFQFTSDARLPLLARFGKKDSKDWDAIIQKATHPIATQRYSDVASLMDEVDNALSGRGIMARPISELEHIVRWGRRSPLTAGLVAAAAIILVCGTLASSNAWQLARNARTKLEKNEAELQKKISEVAAAQDQLASLISQTEVELRTILEVESRQREITKQSIRAKARAFDEQAQSKNLALAAEEVLQKAEASTNRLTTSQKNADSAKEQLSLLDARELKSRYYAQIRGVNDAIESEDWEVADKLLLETDSQFRSIEFSMLKKLILQKEKNVEPITIGMLDGYAAGLPRYGTDFAIEIENGLKSRRVSFPNQVAYAHQFCEYSDPATGAILFKIELKHKNAEFHGVMSDGSLLFSERSVINRKQWRFLLYNLASESNAFETSESALTREQLRLIASKLVFETPKLVAYGRPRMLSSSDPGIAGLISNICWGNSTFVPSNLGTIQTEDLPSSYPNTDVGCSPSIALRADGLLASICFGNRKLFPGRSWYVPATISTKEIMNPLLSCNCIQNFDRITFCKSGDLFLCNSRSGAVHSVKIDGEIGTHPSVKNVVYNNMPVEIRKIASASNISIPNHWDDANLYVTNGNRIVLYPLPLDQGTKNNPWFELSAEGCTLQFSQLITENHLMATVLCKSTTELNNKSATFLFDKQRKGFFVVDRTINASCLSADGTKILHVNNGKLVELRFEYPEPPETYHRIELIGTAVDVHGLKLSEKGFESTHNKYAWPTFEINGTKWTPEKDQFLSSIDLKPSLPPGLNFGASRIEVLTVPGNLDVKYCVKRDSVEFEFLDMPGGSNNCHIIVEVPFLTSVGEEIVFNGVTWSAPWRTQIYAYDEKALQYPPDISSVMKLPALASYDIENVDFIFWNNYTKLLYDGSHEIKELPDDFAIITGDRDFTTQPGTYRVESMSDDGIRVWVDEKLVVDNWLYGTKHKFKDIKLEGGAHKVRFEYFERGSLSRLMCNVRRIR